MVHSCLPRMSSSALAAAGVLTLLLLAATAMACASDVREQNPSPKLQLQPCSDVRPDSGLEAARCGSLRVAENRAHGFQAGGTGREIELNLVVLDALGGDPLPDPIFYLAGGPGAAATDYVGQFLASPLRQKRDLVFVDQRGTGASNLLQCEFPSLQDVLDGGLLFEFPDLESCRDELSQNADLRFYTTSIAMDDLDDVRAALGYEQINLIGGSYGTRAALVYLRRHPERARTATLRGVASTAFNIPRDLVGTLHSVRDLFEDCSAEARCQRVLPEPEQALLEILARLREQPLEIELEDPRSGDAVTVVLQEQHVSEMVRLMLYDSRAASTLPALLAAAHKGDLRPLADAGTQAIATLLPRLSAGMFLSVTCAEDEPFLPSDEEMTTSFAGNPFRPASRVTAMRRLCAVWPRAELSSGFKEHVESDVPTLLLSGAVDPVTSPASAEAVLAHLSHGRHFVLPEVAHGPLAPGCVEDLLARFLDTTSTEGFDPACLAQLERPSFWLD